MMRRWTGLALLLVSGGPALAAAAPPSDPGEVSRRAQTYQLYSLSQQSLLDRDFSSAVDFLERAAARDTDPDLLLELAQLRFTLNDLDRAAVLAQQVATEHPRAAEAHRLLADIALSRARDGHDTDANLGRAIEQYRAALDADPTDLQALQPLAEILFQTGRLDDAATLLHAYARSQSLDASLSLLLGKVEARRGNFEEAERNLRRASDRSPSSLEVADSLAALYEFEKKLDQAIGVYEALLRSIPPTGAIQARIGSLQLRAGRFKDAIGSLEESQRIEPADSSALLALAQAYEASGDTEAAMTRYDRLIQREPGQLEARFHKARLQEKEGDSQAALAGFKALLDLSAGRGALSDREAAILALTHSQIGLIQMDARDWDSAAASFVKALDASDQPGPELFLLLARVHLEAARPAEAERVLSEATRRFPGDLDLQVAQGEVLIVRNDVDGARLVFERLIKEKNGSPDAYARISEAWLRHKKFPLADEVLKEGTRQHPADDSLLFARGAAMERMGEGAQAERLLIKAIRLNPKNAMALNYLGYMLADRGDKLNDSIAYVQRALALDPKNPAYLDSLGWAQFKLALYEPAEKNLRDALRYDQDDPAILEHLGDLLLATGRPEEAVRQWESALSHGSEETARVQDKIRKARGSVQVTR
ncbi:MAG TPA: tetratricopeptide repeat protein [Candidatus Polarisedimenticolia bacterium]